MAKSVDFSAMLDLDRTTLIKDLVDRFETIMREQQSAADDLKALVAECAGEHECSPNDIAAMKKVAKLRLKDQGPQAKAQIRALQRVSRAVQFDLFDAE